MTPTLLPVDPAAMLDPAFLGMFRELGGTKLHKLGLLIAGVAFGLASHQHVPVHAHQQGRGSLGQEEPFGVDFLIRGPQDLR